MSSKSLFSNFVHTVRTNLNLNPLTLFRHKCYVQSLVAIGFWVVHPIAQSIGVALIEFTNCYINLETLVSLVLSFFRFKHYSNSQNIVYFFEWNVLCLHFVPNRIWTFHTRFYLVFQPHLVEFCTNRGCKVLEKRFALCFSRSYFCLNSLISIWVFVAETKVFEFSFYFIQP